MSEGKELQEKLFNEKKNGWDNLSSETKKEIYDYCDSYMNFLNNVSSILFQQTKQDDYDNLI